MLYIKVKAALERRIRAGQVKSGQQLPSEQALMRTHKVSRITIRRALDELEADRLIYRVPGKGTFVAWPSQPQSVQMTFYVMSTYDVYGDAVQNEIFGGIQQEAQRLGCRLHIHHLLPSDDIPVITRQMEQDHQFHGYILMGRMPETIMQWARNRADRVVLVDNVADQSIPAVLGDNVDGACQIMRHLLELGHRTILHITRPAPAVTMIQRQAGWEKALREAGIDPAPSAVLQFPYKLDNAFFPNLHKRLTACQPTAVFCANDSIATGIIGYLLRQGRQVPADLSVAGFDDVSAAEQLGLTTVSVPRREMGLMAVRKLVNRIRGTAVESAVTVLPVRLVVRHSTGPCPALRCNRGAVDIPVQRIIESAAVP